MRVGSKVLVTRKTHGHNFDIGETVKCVSRGSTDAFVSIGNYPSENFTWCMMKSEYTWLPSTKKGRARS